MRTITIEVERYAYPRRSHRFEIPAYIVGSLAVHRAAFWGDGEPPEPADLCRGSWTVTHIATGLHMEAAMPRAAQATRKAAVTWAERMQEAQPAFFAALDANPADWRDIVMGSRETLLRAGLEAGKDL